MLCLSWSNRYVACISLSLAEIVCFPVRYQVETLASIGTNDALQSASNTPNVVLKTSPRGAICTLVGNQVHVFDAGCTTLLSTLNLGGAAELATWSADGSFLVVATSLGVVIRRHTGILFVVVLVQFTCPY